MPKYQDDLLSQPLLQNIIHPQFMPHSQNH